LGHAGCEDYLAGDVRGIVRCDLGSERILPVVRKW
jgi:hypothetical protein